MDEALGNLALIISINNLALIISLGTIGYYLSRIARALEDRP